MAFPIAPAEIQKTESKTGIVFPLGLKARLSRQNGGEVDAAHDTWQLIPFFDTSDRKRLARTCNDIVRESEKMREWRGFPPGGYVIASNGGGDYLVILPTAPSSQELGEAIYFWDHETGELSQIADSIEELG